MKENEIVELRRRIELAVKESNDEAALSLLTQFDAWTPTAETLKTTRIGMFVNTLRKNAAASEKVRAKANTLTRAWTRAVTAATSTTATPPLHRNLSTSSVSSTTGTGATPVHAHPLIRTSSLHQEQSHQQSPASVTAASATSVSSPVEISFDPAFDASVAVKDSLGDKARDKTVELFSAALGTGIMTVDPKLLLWKARQIEDGLCREFNGVTDRYKSQFRTLLSNIKNVDNLRLRADILGGKMDPRKMATMSAEDLMSESVKIAKERAEREISHWASTAKSVEAVTDEFKCGKCGKRKSTYYQKQTRSADEPMTTFVTCQNCGNKWKFC
ncbi:Transcription elongation factor A protein 1 [Chytriomyces hyalinus]|nr:Transcription elongation factor A protein 1 [Chytriomyces hyalinus]